MQRTETYRYFLVQFAYRRWLQPFDDVMSKTTLGIGRIRIACDLAPIRR